MHFSAQVTEIGNKRQQLPLSLGVVDSKSLSGAMGKKTPLLFGRTAYRLEREMGWAAILYGASQQYSKRRKQFLEP